MKPILVAAFSALILSSTALGQEDWVYIECELGFRSMSVQPSPDGSYTVNSSELPLATSEETRIFRFNSNQIDAFQAIWGTWETLCQPVDDWNSAECELSANRFYSLRSRVEGVRSYMVSIDIARLTGQIWIQESTFFGEPPMSARVGTGSCSPSTEPAVAVRRF